MALYEVYETNGCGYAVSVIITQSESTARAMVEELLEAGGEAWYEQIQ